MHTGSQVTLRTYESRLLVKFESLPDQFRFKRISGAQLFFYFLATEGSYDWYDAHANTKEFDEKTATWDTWNEAGYNLVFQRKGVGDAPVWAEFPSASILFGDAVTYGIRLQSSLLNAKPFTVQTSGANRPYLVLTIDESATADTLNISSMSPNAGAIDKYRDVLSRGAQQPHTHVLRDSSNPLQLFSGAQVLAERSIHTASPETRVVSPSQQKLLQGRVSNGGSL